MRPYNLYDEKMLSFNTLQFFIYTVYMAAYLILNPPFYIYRQDYSDTIAAARSFRAFL